MEEKMEEKMEGDEDEDQGSWARVEGPSRDEKRARDSRETAPGGHRF